jgi:hypothetical protein
MIAEGLPISSDVTSTEFGPSRNFGDCVFVLLERVVALLAVGAVALLGAEELPVPACDLSFSCAMLRLASVALL